MSHRVETTYPVDTPFLTFDEIDEYLSGNRIVCLICGKPLKSLAAHLWRIHEMRADDYKSKYGIPWTYGLVCAETNNKISKNQKNKWENGMLQVTVPGPTEWLKSHSTKHRPVVEAIRALNREKISSIKQTYYTCECGNTFTRGPHAYRKTLCEECFQQKYPRLYRRRRKVTTK